MGRARGPALAALAGAAMVGVLGAVGADLGWAAALGGEILDHGSIPDGIPFAASASHGWPNVPVGAEVVLSLLWQGLGARGLLLAQAAAVAIALGFVAADARAGGARRAQIAAVLLLVAVAGFSTLAVIRMQLFSLALFPMLAYLLRSEARRPTRRIWLVVPLVAAWSNLHGAVLLGVLVIGAYLLFRRAREQPWSAAGVLVALPLALCATPALNRTVTYYAGVFGNEAAARGTGLWARLALDSGLDTALAVGCLLLVALALRSRLPLWEFVCVLGFSVATVGAARNGIWLALFAAVPAARALPRVLAERPAGRQWSVGVAAVAVMAVALGFARGPVDYGAGNHLVADVVARSGGEPVLATPAIAEQLALAGGRIWIANPLDAFRSSDQKLYLDWLEGKQGGSKLLDRIGVVVVHPGTPADRMDADTRFQRAMRDERAIVFVRRSG